ncbi:hypothetical protein [Rheinheimera pacifica]|uniref:hypothetical protein n=1 Tax=Rheinheimera pacifica TaxID=173990 RepID=UPI0015A65716|nr:hypothetical protein [Rheinheimera pacifica]
MLETLNTCNSRLKTAVAEYAWMVLRLITASQLHNLAAIVKLWQQELSYASKPVSPI